VSVLNVIPFSEHSASSEALIGRVASAMSALPVHSWRNALVAEVGVLETVTPGLVCSYAALTWLVIPSVAPAATVTVPGVGFGSCANLRWAARVC
jgi:hypothetical protein